MRISQIQPKSFFNVNTIQNTKLNTYSHIKQINPNEIFKYYMGKELVSFGNSSQEQIKGLKHPEYFKLPAGCSPDLFQQEAGIEISKGNNVLVEAPTGTGKTAIAHYATANNMANGKKTFYTTPLKALSNQKLNEFREIYGEENVGILTGDRRENVEAPIIIMTTEVYRNMSLANMYGDKNPIMDNLGTVIFDEFHYLGDNERGPVWEESVMYTPEDVQILALSATIGNSDELKDWIENTNGQSSSLVQTSKRYVPLEYGTIETSSYKADEKKSKKHITQTTGEKQEITKPVLSDFKYATDFLSKEDKLPAIFFVFSRKFSKSLLDYFVAEGKPLTTDKEQEEIKKIINKYQSKKYIGADINIKALKNGYAIHNAGIIPAQKELIEELFQKKLLKVVIATETLAAGINMPARTVVISSPFKPTESDTEDINIRLLSSNEFKQMSGRAGRRGIDDIGYVYTLPTDLKTENEFTVLQLSESNPIKSQYEPDYCFLSGFFEYNTNPEELREIFGKTFYAFKPDQNSNRSEVGNLMKTSKQKINVLEKRGFITNKNGEYEITSKGYMASKVRGYDTLTLVETIADKTFKDITPEALASIAGILANPIKTKEQELSVYPDLSSLVSNTSYSIPIIQNKLISNINTAFARMGVNTSQFNSYEEMLEFAKSIKTDKKADELYAEYQRQYERRAKLYTITATSCGYTTDLQVYTALKNGETLPSKTLFNYAEKVDDYKFKIRTREIDSYIEKLENRKSEIAVSGKGNKAKARALKELEEIEKEISQAIIMKFLDENLENAIAANHEFLKNNPPEIVKKEYTKAENEYYRHIQKDSVISSIKAVMAIEKYSSEHNTKADSLKDTDKMVNCINKIIEKSLEINSTEEEEGISSLPTKYGKTILNAMYLWSSLNKASRNNLLNWQELIKLIPSKDIDEGGLYRAILQTSDLLSQIGEIAQAGAETSTNTDDLNYYKQLKNTADTAKSLIIQNPVEI